MFEAIRNYFAGIEWTSPATLSGLTIVAAVISFSILERFFPYKKLPYFRKGWYLDLVWYTFIQSYLLGIIIFQLIIGPARDALNLPEEGLLSHWPIWALVLLFFVTHDFYIYWFHRLQHSSKLFWRTHEAHHSVEQVDFLAGSRSHAVEIIINQTIEFAPIIILLDPVTGVTVKFIKATIDAVWGQFIHSNLNIKLGKLGYIINGPEHHQWHHADHVEVYHANFATKLSIWDWIFGTMYLPGKKPKKYGLWYRFPRDYFMQHIFSVYRFNVEKAEERPVIKWYINFRINCINAFRKIFTLRKPKPRPLNGKPVYAPKLELVEPEN
jgi:sterol desaturase/sphingolipid hydroxylase (fatty acid hydroxylase superfamily)